MVNLNCTGIALAYRKILITTDARSTHLQLEFMRPLTAAMLSERRAVQPFGLMGGGNAAKGMNLIIRKDGHTVNMGAKNVAKFQVIFFLNENMHRKSTHMICDIRIIDRQLCTILVACVCCIRINLHIY